MSNSAPCVFCDILRGQSPQTTIEFDNENIVIFKDIRPASDFHYLAVSKEHIPDIRSLNNSNRALGIFRISTCICYGSFHFLVFPAVMEMRQQLEYFMGRKGADLSNVSYGFHLPPFISVKHLHMHAIAPISNMSLISRMIFARNNFWYCSVWS